VCTTFDHECIIARGRVHRNRILHQQLSYVRVSHHSNMSKKRLVCERNVLKPTSLTYKTNLDYMSTCKSHFKSQIYRIVLDLKFIFYYDIKIIVKVHLSEICWTCCFTRY